MQDQDKQKTSEASHTHSDTITKKQKIQVIHRNPSIDMLKKMFVRTKNRSQNVPFQQSLLFDRNNSIAMLKAYRNRKKIILQDVPNKLKQNEFDKNSNYKFTIDSPQKINFCLESSKYQFNKNDINQQLYNQIIQKIQISAEDTTFKLPEISSINPKISKRVAKSQNHGSKWQKKTLPALNQVKGEQSPKLEIGRAASRTIQPNYNSIANRNEFYRIRNVKNQKNQQQSNKIILMKGSLRQSLQNPELTIDIKPQIPVSQTYGTLSQCKVGKQKLTCQNTELLPQLKIVKSVKSLILQQSSIHKGYMYFHLQEKSYLKQHKQKLNEQAKIKQFLISGVTATSFAVVDLQTMTPIATKNFHKKIQIASISKVMTCYLCLLACKKYGIDYKKHLVRITHQASQMNGTSAGLQIGDCLTLQDLLYALMLPSGNDAAVAIAQTIGKIIQRYKRKQTKKTYYQTFIAHMNVLSRELKLQQSWKNSHGLPLNPNHSTPHDICLLTIAAMMDDKFKQIVCCKQYEAAIKNQRTGLKKISKWKNTNKLLYDGWQGVKTGTTDSAGHCLMAKKQRYLIAVFDSQTLSKRFTQCVQLYDMVKSKQRYLFPQKWQ